MKRISNFFLTFILILGISGTGLADSLVNPDHPDQYIVKKGDTLWDIAGMFLNKPWRWPEIWQVNPHIKNPHLIYPGDVLTLTYVDGQPRLTLHRGRTLPSGVVKLSPGVRILPSDAAIPTVPLDAIAPFMTQSLVLEDGVLDKAPYVVAFADEHMIAGARQRIYVRGIDNRDHKNYDIVRQGRELRDGQTGELLGHAAQYSGNGELLHVGDPATLLVTSSEMHIAAGDYLLPVTNEHQNGNFHPKSPSSPIEGTIITALNGVEQIGKFDVIVLDRGSADGLEPGDVLQVNHAGEVIRDKHNKRGGGTLGEEVQLPDEEAGLIMVFRTFNRVSIALVMDSVRAMHVGDKFINP